MWGRTPGGVFPRSPSPSSRPLYGLKREDVLSIRRLADGSEVPISASWVHSDYPDLVFAELGPNPVLPDGTDTVLEVRLRERA